MHNSLHTKLLYIKTKEVNMKTLKGAHLLYATLNMRKQLNKLLAKGNLSTGEYLVLRNVSKDDGYLKASELSEILELSRPSITRILNDLEKRNYITRMIDKDDRRNINIELTDEGRKALEQANGRILAVAERIVDSLGESDTDKLIELVEKLTETYKVMLEESWDDE
jgi:DNA-binding MarR family transcriptional regulator